MCASSTARAFLYRLLAFATCCWCACMHGHHHRIFAYLARAAGMTQHIKTGISTLYPGRTECVLRPPLGASLHTLFVIALCRYCTDIVCSSSLMPALLHTAKDEINNALHNDPSACTAGLPDSAQDAGQASSNLDIVPACCPTASLIAMRLTRTSTLAQAAHSGACGGQFVTASWKSSRASCSLPARHCISASDCASSQGVRCCANCEFDQELERSRCGV